MKEQRIAVLTITNTRQPWPEEEFRTQSVSLVKRRSRRAAVSRKRHTALHHSCFFFGSAAAFLNSLKWEMSDAHLLRVDKIVMRQT